MVITTNINGYRVKRILVDQGSSTNVMYHHTFKKLGGKDADLQPATNNLVSFTGEEIQVTGTIKLPFSLSRSGQAAKHKLKMKFIIPTGVGKICADYEEAKFCYMASMTNQDIKEECRDTPLNKNQNTEPYSTSDIIDLQDEIPGVRPKPSKDLIPIRIYGE
ncbi:uncharacterized protein G2W53_039500 [Senna tora]|uniref:Uncharacterized protein n=1 Tax=Senna tora TaxID=362788 RepID=A0A834SNR0_9FABA|nr:uncharacterized protein G2W53_039500 [Senna tora]